MAKVFPWRLSKANVHSSEKARKSADTATNDGCSFLSLVWHN
ncbi:hypothetical protein [Runella sp.]